MIHNQTRTEFGACSFVVFDCLWTAGRGSSCLSSKHLYKLRNAQSLVLGQSSKPFARRLFHIESHPHGVFPDFISHAVFYTPKNTTPQIFLDSVFVTYILHRMPTQKGRPKRKDNPVRVTLYLSSKGRSLVGRLACQSNQSVSQFIDSLIQRAHQERISA